MLDDNCKKFVVDSNSKVVGVELQIIPVEGAKFKIDNCRLENEYEAKGKTIAYNTLPKSADGYRVALCYPYEGKPEFKNILFPGNDKGEHPIINEYSPPSLGYLSLCIVDRDKKVVSDILRGLGLPYRRHVSFRVVWDFKDENNKDEPTTENELTVVELLKSLHKKIDKIVYFLEGE